MKILRWIAVLPAALIGAMLAYVVVRIFGNWFSPVPINEMGSLMGKIYEFFDSVIFGALFVLIGASVAPSNRKIVSIVLAAIIVILSVINILSFVLQLREFDLQIMITCIAASIGSIGGAINVFEDVDKKGEV